MVPCGGQKTCKSFIVIQYHITHFPLRSFFPTFYFNQFVRLKYLASAFGTSFPLMPSLIFLAALQLGFLPMIYEP